MEFGVAADCGFYATEGEIEAWIFYGARLRGCLVPLGFDLGEAEGDGVRVAVGGKGVHPGAAGVGEAEQFGYLVVGLACGVVDGAAYVAVGPEAVRCTGGEVEVAVAAGDDGGEQRAGVGEVLFGLKQDGLDVAFEVVDGDERETGAEGQGFGEADADEERASQAGAFRNGYGGEVAVARDAGCGHRLPDDRDDVAEVFAAGEFGDDAAVAGVDQLGGNDVGEDFAALRDDGRGGLVTGAFDSKNEAWGQQDLLRPMVENLCRLLFQVGAPTRLFVPKS